MKVKCDLSDYFKTLEVNPNQFELEIVKSHLGFEV